VFTILLDKHTDIWNRLLQLYLPAGGAILDFTAGKGLLHKKLDPSKYRVILCDKEPLEGQVRKDLMADRYDDLGVFDAAVFDPPYLINRLSMNQPTRGKQWDDTGLGKHVSNQSLEEFNARVAMLNLAAPSGSAGGRRPCSWGPTTSATRSTSRCCGPG
jgi:hypothetical protein